MQSVAIASTPSIFAPEGRRRRRRPPKGRVEQLTGLFTSGLDLWTGQPLQGDDLKDWRTMQAGSACVRRRPRNPRFLTTPV
jgi:hypothetical protein